jgi:hypothetical protein
MDANIYREVQQRRAEAGLPKDPLARFSGGSGGWYVPQPLGQADGIMSALEGYYDKARDTVGDFYDRNERALKVAAALAAAGALGYGAYEAKRQLPDKIRALAVQKGMELYRQFRPRK